MESCVVDELESTSPYEYCNKTEHPYNDILVQYTEVACCFLAHFGGITSPTIRPK